MVLLRSLLLSACGILASLAASAGHELLPIGTLPELPADWEISMEDQQPKADASLPFHWVVFRHRKSGDFLSFAALPPEAGKRRGLEFWSDTALEIFPRGRPVWTQARIEATNTVLNRKSVSPKSDVLEFCFITESPGLDNTMAHARVWAGKKGIVFVQHTSTRPMTPETVENVVSELIDALQDRDASN